MLTPIRYTGLLVLAICAGIGAERAIGERTRVQDELARAGRQNQERVEQIEAERLARLEAHAEVVRRAAEAAREEATRNARWTTRPLPRTATAEAPPAPEPRRVAPVPASLRAAAKSIEGAIKPAAKGSDASRAAELSPPEEEKREPRAPGTGLRGEYWKLVDQQLRDVPQDIDRILPTVVRVDPRLDFAAAGAFKLPWMTRNVAVRWRGFIYAEADGIYTFSVTCDDGMVLAIDGKTIIDNGGLHPVSTKGADTYLIEGYHAIEVRYFQNEGDAVAVLQWVPMRGEPGPVPTDVLYPAEQVRATEAPVIDKIEPARARSGQTVIIRGSGFPAPPEPVEATFGGVSMHAESIGAGQIRATLPPGVDVGQVIVRVRDRSSLGYRYESGDIFGLLGEYVPSPEGRPLSSLRELPRAGSPDAFRRCEPMIAFYSLASFSLPFPASRFGARFAGSICVQESGEYAFKLTCDDGARFWIGGEPVVDLDGLHGMASGEAATFLARGFHDVFVEYFNNDHGGGLLLEWRPPGATRWGLVPRRALYPPPETARSEPPVIQELDPDPCTVGETVEIRGAHFTGNPELDRVLVNGVPVPIDHEGRDRIRITLPNDARSGNIVVQAGELVSKPFALKIVGRGLRGAYYRSEDELTSMPEFTTMTPVFERVDSGLYFGEQYSFDLPFAPERFAVRWTGTIEAPVAGTYRFRILSDDGSRLEIGGRPVVENDGVHGFQGVSGEIALTAGRHPIKLSYFNNSGFASFDFWWGAPGKAPERVPETVLFPQ